MKKRLALVLATVAVCFVAAPAFASATWVSPAHIAQYTNPTGHPVKVTNYTTPKLDEIGNRHIYYYVYKKNSDGDYVYKTRFEGTLYNSDAYDSSTRAKGKLEDLKKGTYRVRAKLVWKDSDGDTQVRTSTYRYFVMKNMDYQAPTSVSAPTTKSYSYDVGDTFMLRSWVTPKFHTTENKAAWYHIYRKNSDGDYVYKTRVAANLVLSEDYDTTTRLWAKTSIEKSGYYRIRVRFVWHDADGDTHVMKSAYHYIHVTD